MSPLVGGECVWMASAPGGEGYAALDGDVSADVCVVGAGMTGLLTAWHLLERGLDVVVLDQRAIASAVTGYTTSKLTSQHGLKYSHLETRHGADAARWYGAANERALERIFALQQELDIDGDLERRDAYVYASQPESTDLVRAEAEAAARAGLPAAFTDDVPLPFATHGAVVFTAQGQFHPRKLLLGLAERFVAAGGRIHEHTKALEVTGNGPLLVQTEAGHAVSARHVVLATLVPTPHWREFYSRSYCHQGFAVALPVDDDPLPTGVFINADRPMRSLRTIDTGDGRMLQVGGSAFVDDPTSGAQPWDDLEAWGRNQFAGVAAGAARYRWTTQDYSTTDGLPIIGPLETAGTIHVACGFGGWGLTTAGVAAEVITAQVCGEREDWHGIFAPTRDLPKVDTSVISGHRSGPAAVSARATLDALAPGEALVLDVDGEEVAAFREDDGTLHRVSAACTHLGCIVLWHQGDREWECPCHGSRFAPDGAVRKGPAGDPLPQR